MADAASRAQRAAALEERRRKLEELRQRRAMRAGGGGGDNATTATRSSNLEEYIDGLLAAPGAAATGGGGAVQQQQQVAATTTSTSTADTNDNNISPMDNSQGTTAAAAAASDAAAAATTTPTLASPAAAAPPPLKKVETFTISTQTEEPWQDDEKDNDNVKDKKTPDETKDASHAAGAVVVEPDDATTSKQQQQQPDERQPNLLSPEQVASEVTRHDFTTFLTTASKKVERVLGSTEWHNLLVDSVALPNNDDDQNDDKDNNDDKAQGLVTSRTVFEAGKWTAFRDVTDVRWSPQARDVFLAAYHAPSTPYGSSSSSSTTTTTTMSHHNNAAATAASSLLTPRSGELQADGLVLIWTTTMPSRPEHVLTCASPVLHVRQPPATGQATASSASLVLGGCASGQVVVWDVRAGGRYPVQTSALTSLAMASSNKQQQQGHVHPICGMEVTDGGAGLVTTSLDGRVNFWSMSNLREPVESIQVPGGSVSCLAVAPESESLIMGDDQGSLFTVTASSSSAAATTNAAANTKKKTSLRRKQVRKLELSAVDAQDDTNILSSNGHFGMVTSVATRPRIQTNTGLAKGFCRGSAGLVLTTGVDWTTQLWAPAYRDTPLLSWTSHSYDSVSDVQWNPYNPGIFATASSNGTVGLWNLSQSLDESLTDGLAVSATTAGGDGQEVEGLTKLAWSIPDGRRLAVAGGGGRIHLLTLADEVVRPKGDEDAKIVQQLVARGFLSRP